jgi:multidrug efflux pump subunit AcrB
VNAETDATPGSRSGGPAAVHVPAERSVVRVVTRVDRARRSGAAELGRLQVAGAGGLVPLAELGQVVERAEDQPIMHKDLERVAFVLGEVAGRPPADVVFALDDVALPHGAVATWSGEGEWKITVDVFRDLGLAFAAALVGIYVLLVIETGSFRLPLVIMLRSR